MVKLPQTVECTLENGLQTQCALVVLKYQLDNIEVGPFSPETLDDEVEFGIGMAPMRGYID